MVLIEENGFIKALHPSNDVYLMGYNLEENGNINTYINTNELKKLEDFVNRVRPGMKVELLYA